MAVHHTVTRAEHLRWCKDRAIQEYDYYQPREGHEAAARNAVASMASDLSKHPETNAAGHLGGQLGLAMLMSQSLSTREKVVQWIEGFN